VFESRWGQEFSILHVVHMDSGANPASYPMGTEGSSPGGTAAVSKAPAFGVLVSSDRTGDMYATTVSSCEIFSRGDRDGERTSGVMDYMITLTRRTVCFWCLVSGTLC
jgi:hypothetical protein